MTTLVNDLLDVSRVTRGMVELEMAEVDVKAVVTQAAEQVHPLIEAGRHALVVQLGAARACVLGDRARLIQVTANLLANAAKYTPPGGSIALSVEPADGKGYDRDPRTIAKRAEAYLKSSGIGDTAYFGPEPEFFVFDSITWKVDMSGCFVKIKSEEAPWSTGDDFEGGNMGHRAPVKGGYFPVAPADSLQDLRNAMALALEEQGVEVEVHHHEVAAPGQCEIGTKFNSLIKRADWN